MQSVFLPLSLLALLLYAGAGISQETPATPETPETEHEATQIELEGVPFQQVLDQLFGTSETTGLLNVLPPRVEVQIPCRPGPPGLLGMTSVVC
jgi:hypothetical protein